VTDYTSKSWTNVTLMPKADDTDLTIHPDPRPLVSFRCGDSTILFETARDAFKWLDRCVDMLTEAL